MTHDLPSSERIRAHAARLSAHIAHAPHPGSLPSFIAGQRCGWAVPRAVKALCDSGLASEQDGTLQLGAGLPPRSDALARHCASAARVLQEAGCLLGWRNELLDIYPEAGGEPLGRIERTATRPLGLRTLAVHLNAWTPDGRIWLARRALTKNTDPGLWDTLVGGLASGGEPLDLALLRECAEEAGLEPHELARRSPLRTIVQVRHRLPEGFQVEDVLVSHCVLDEDASPANRDGEVMEIRQVAPLEVMEMMETGMFTQEACIVLADDLLRVAESR